MPAVQPQRNPRLDQCHVSELAFDLEGPRRSFALAIQQMVELSELLANRALDIAAPR